MKNEVSRVHAVSACRGEVRRYREINVNETIEISGVMRVVCGTCNEEGGAALAESAIHENNHAGSDMAVGCIFSDRPLSPEEIARLVMERGSEQLMRKRMIAGGDNRPGLPHPRRILIG